MKQALEALKQKFPQVIYNTIHQIIIYFRLRFDLANEINYYFRLKIRVVCIGNFLL